MLLDYEEYHVILGYQYNFRLGDLFAENKQILKLLYIIFIIILLYIIL